MYTLTRITQELRQAVTAALGVPDSDVSFRINDRPGIAADLTLPCFPLAKTLQQNPNDIAAKVVEAVQTALPTLVNAAGILNGYANFQLNRAAVTTKIMLDFRNDLPYGWQEVGRGKTVVTDFSSPNIAKPFSVGHLRSTVIGDAINKLHLALGYTVIGDNHLGDWGGQFGKLIVAYKLWGDKAVIERDPITELNKLYVRFNSVVKGLESLPESQIDEEAEDAAGNTHPLIVQARDWFRKLEAGDQEARDLWEWFIRISMKDFMKIYEVLGVKFEEMLGEAFYEDKMAPVVRDLEERGLIFTDAGGAKLVRTGLMVKDKVTKKDVDSAMLVMKSDGASLYATRDLAAAVYRVLRWQPAKILYVIGSEQEFQFKQLFAVLRKMGMTTDFEHIGFGMVMIKVGVDGKGKDILEKMSTRAGKVILLEDLLAEAIKRSRQLLDERSSDLPEADKEAIARQIGVGAIKYNDLSRERTGNIVFDWEQMLSLDGNSGPYLQYMVARTNSLLRKAGTRGPADPSAFGAAEWPLLIKLAQYPDVIQEAAETYLPHKLAGYLYELSQLFSSYYSATPVATEPDPTIRDARLELTEMVQTVLKGGLELLGIDCPERM